MAADPDRRTAPPDGPGIPVVTGTRALTCCCPARRRVEPTPAEWLESWGLDAYVQWRGRTVGINPVAGASLVVNEGGTVFSSAFPGTYTTTLRDLALGGVPDAPLAAIYALSVLDRVDAPKLWLRACAETLPPGGLLACSFAYWDAEGEDCAVGHERRRRIYTRKMWEELAWMILPQEGFALLGTADWTYRGHACLDHTIATVVAVRTAQPVSGRKGVWR